MTLRKMVRIAPDLLFFHPKLSTKGGLLKTIICEVFTIHKNEDYIIMLLSSEHCHPLVD